MSESNPLADNFFEAGCGRCSKYNTPACKVNFWRKELLFLRQIVLECGLVEEVKWSVPTYTFEGKNVVLLNCLKDYCFLGFMKGSLLSDAHGLLFRQTENMQATRLLRFTSLQQVTDFQNIIKETIFEAVEIEKADLKIEYKPTSEFDFPEELKEKLSENAAFRAAWDNLTPGRQRGWLLHFSGPKQSKTRLDRIEKARPLIFEGKGMHDDYRQNFKKNK